MYWLIAVAAGVVVIVALVLLSRGSGSPTRSGAPPPSSANNPQLDEDHRPQQVASGAAHADKVPQLRREVADIAQRYVIEGYQTEVDILEFAVELAAESGVGYDFEVKQIESVVAEVVPELMAEQREREQGWTTPTDCDRLNRAFGRLEESGIIARQHFGETQRDGFDRMLHEEVPEASDSGRTVRGFTFFNVQTTQGAVEGGGLTLSYGAADMNPEATVPIANEVVRALQDAGLQAQWSGTLQERIVIDGLDWKRRRFTEAPQEQ